MRTTRVFAATLGLVGAVVAWSVGACGVGSVDLANRPCPCSTGYVCDAARNVCVTTAELADGGGADGASGDAAGPCLGDSCPCATGPDCHDPAFPVCLNKQCVECTTTPDSCTAGRYCLPTNECAPGCKSNDECAALSPSAPFCNLARHQCVNCAVDNDCTGGKKCSPAGACVVGCTGVGAGTCTGGASCCNGLCLDTTSDPLNCNACGKVCPGSGSLCCAGTCSDPLTDVANCGKCGTPCGALPNTTGPACKAGSCSFTACLPNYGDCSSQSPGCESNLTSNSDHCSSCQIACDNLLRHTVNPTCQASVCKFTQCSAGYADLDGNPGNGCETPCGAATQVCCPPGNTCNVGLACVTGHCQ
jgi:hypothetical protein